MRNVKFIRWPDPRRPRPAPAIALALSLAACAAERPAQRLEPEPKLAPHPARVAPTSGAAPLPSPGIRRDELLGYLENGPHHFIRQVRVRPAFLRGRFFGWRIVEYSGPGRLQRGDIVLKVNRKPIERPDQFMAVWDGLSTCKRLEVDLLRGGRPLTLLYPIVDGPAPR